MDVDPPSPPPQDAPAVVAVRARRLSRRAAPMIGAGVMIFAATEYLAAAFMARHPYTVTLPASWLVLFGLAAMLVLAGAVAFAVRHWVAPARRLASELNEAREGELPIEHVG